MLTRRTPKPAEPVRTSAYTQATVPDQLLDARAAFLFFSTQQSRVSGPATIVTRHLSVMLRDYNSEVLKIPIFTYLLLITLCNISSHRSLIMLYPREGQGLGLRSLYSLAFQYPKVLLKVILPGVEGSGSQRRKSESAGRKREDKKGQLINPRLSVVSSKARNWEGWDSPHFFFPVFLKIATFQSP